jgi:hypothetical protein
VSLPAFEGIEVLGVGTDLQLPPAAFRLVLDAELPAGLEVFVLEHGAVSFRSADRLGLVFRTGSLWSRRHVNRRLEGLSGRVVVLLDDGEEPEASWDTPWVLEDPSRRGVWSSESWRLEPHPLTLQPSRDWAWSWHEGSAGPIELKVSLNKSADELAAWVKTSWPMPYALPEPLRYRALNYDGIERQHELRLFDGGLVLVRDFHTPPAERVAFDGGLLRALAEGALGPLTWDLMDGDFGHYLATGDDGESLARLIDPAADEASQEAQWRGRFERQDFDGSAATTQAELLTALSVFLGAGAPIEEPAFDSWLSSRPLASLPRCVRVTLSRSFEAQHRYQWLFDRVRAAQPRIQWAVTTR